LLQASVKVAGLVLQLGQGGGGRARSHFCRVCWSRPGLALGLGVVGAAVLLGDAEAAQLIFQAAAALAAGQVFGRRDRGSNAASPSAR
jgi:hypothetical protein